MILKKSTDPGIGSKESARPRLEGYGKDGSGTEPQNEERQHKKFDKAVGNANMTSKRGKTMHPKGEKERENNEHLPRDKKNLVP